MAESCLEGSFDHQSPQESSFADVADSRHERAAVPSNVKWEYGKHGLLLHENYHTYPMEDPASMYIELVRILQLPRSVRHSEWEKEIVKLVSSRWTPELFESFLLWNEEGDSDTEDFDELL